MPTVKTEIERLRALIADEQEKRRLRDEPRPEEAKTPHHERTGHWGEARQAIRNEAWNMMLLIEHQARVIAEAREAIQMLHQNGRWDNGVTDPTGTIDEGSVTTGRYVGEMLALLSDNAEVRS